MAQWLVLEDFVGGAAALRAGTVIDDAAYPLTPLVASGLAVVPYNPATMAASVRGFLAMRANKVPTTSPDGDLTALLLAAGALGGGAPSAASVSYDDSIVPPFGSTNVQGALDAAKADLAAQGSDIATAQGDIATLAGDVATAQGDIATLQGDVATIQGDLAALPTLAEGTYAPTITIVTPGTLAATAPEPFKYARVGDTVHVTGYLSVTPASLAGFNEIDVDLPIATTDPASISGVCSGSSLPRGSNDLLLTSGVIVNSGGVPAIHFTLAFANAPGQFTLGVDFSYRTA